MIHGRTTTGDPTSISDQHVRPACPTSCPLIPDKGPEADVENTFCLVGKGVTFDSGGISIKPSASMGDMRADMGGAAVTVAAMKAIAQAGLKGRIVALTPLAENMPAGNASKPGDVVVARNGKTIQIDNTDAEGRLLLCDTLGKYPS